VGVVSRPERALSTTVGYVESCRGPSTPRPQPHGRGRPREPRLGERRWPTVERSQGPTPGERALDAPLRSARPRRPVATPGCLHLPGRRTARPSIVTIAPGRSQGCAGRPDRGKSGTATRGGNSWPPTVWSARITMKSPWVPYPSTGSRTSACGRRPGFPLRRNRRVQRAGPGPVLRRGRPHRGGGGEHGQGGEAAPTAPARR
jgi:hypothetical protein